MAHVAQWKNEFREDLHSQLKDKPVIGLVDVHGIDAPTMNRIREKLRERGIYFRVGKKTLMKLVMENCEDTHPGLAGLTEHYDGQPGVVASKLNPFIVYKELVATMTPSPAKGGEEAPDDIVIKKGDTPFKPGPIIGELQKVGLPAAIDGGKIIIRADKLLVKQGDTISRDVALVLQKLGVNPLIVGLKALAVYEDGMIFKPSQLVIDETQFLGDIAQAVQSATNLAVNVAFPATGVMPMIISKAFRDAKALALEAAIPAPAIMPDLLAKSHRGMLALAAEIGSKDPAALDEQLQAALSASAQAAAAAAPAQAAPAEEKKEDDQPEEEEEQVSEEDAAAGLGALFG